MPRYDFQCNKCDHTYDEIVPRPDDTGLYEGVVCPECGSVEKTKLVSMFSFKFANPVGTDRWTSEETGHDYRFKYNAPNVKKQRELAESLSHMGSDPYGDTSAADINLDTGIHHPETRPGLT